MKVGDKVCVVPSNESGVLKAISLTNEVPLGQCFAGDSVILSVGNVCIENIFVGNFACDANATMPVSDKLRAKIVVFNVEMLIKGFPVSSAFIDKLYATEARCIVFLLLFCISSYNLILIN